MVPRERITFEKETKGKNPNGSPRKSYDPIPGLSNVPAERRKAQPNIGDGLNAVSYTHLTLPTILRV